MLRRLLGDWRNVGGAQDVLDSLARDDLYVRRGFDVQLVARPEPGFSKLNQAVGLYPFATTEDAVGAVFAGETAEEGVLRRRMARVYSWLWRLEVDLRSFIHATMVRVCGQGWEKQRLPGNREMYDRWVERRERDARERAASQPLIAYADFTDYEPLITRSNNWKECFQPIFHHPEFIRESLRRLHAVRLPTAHARPVTKSEELFVAVEVQRILMAIGKLLE